jgi:hypothetical protein
MNLGEQVVIIGTDADIESCRGRAGTVDAVKPFLPLPIRVRFADGSQNWFHENELKKAKGPSERRQEAARRAEVAGA